MLSRPVFVTGGTGYIGRPLVDALLERGYPVHALVRPGSERRLPAHAAPVTGDALDDESFAAAIPAQATIVHLVGTPHPNPSKAAEFHRVDLGSIRATAIAAQRAQANHIVYVSVAHPAPVMHAYVAARVQAKRRLRRRVSPPRSCVHGTFSDRDTDGRSCCSRRMRCSSFSPPRATRRIGSGSSLERR